MDLVSTYSYISNAKNNNNKMLQTDTTFTYDNFRQTLRSSSDYAILSVSQPAIKRRIYCDCVFVCVLKPHHNPDLRSRYYGGLHQCYCANEYGKSRHVLEFKAKHLSGPWKVHLKSTLEFELFHLIVI